MRLVRCAVDFMELASVAMNAGMLFVGDSGRNELGVSVWSEEHEDVFIVEVVRCIVC